MEDLRVSGSVPGDRKRRKSARTPSELACEKWQDSLSPTKTKAFPLEAIRQAMRCTLCLYYSSVALRANTPRTSDHAISPSSPTHLDHETEVLAAATLEYALVVVFQWMYHLLPRERSPVPFCCCLHGCGTPMQGYKQVRDARRTENN